jgi:hypothetical protein
MSNYGLLWTDVVNSFSQAISADFAVGAVAGDTIINAEIDFQKNKLEAALPADALRLMERVEGEIVTVDPSGNFSPTLYATNLRAYVVDKGVVPCPSQSFESNDTCWQSIDEQWSVTAANISAAGNNAYVLLDTIDTKNENLVIYYEVDATNLSVPSLKSILRSMVCCSLGSRIYPAADADTWSVVKYYCEDTDKWLEYFKDGGLPAEMKKMRIAGKTRGITSLRVARS